MTETNPPKFRRQRPSLVCENCRRKKIKCDKLEPCSQCVKAKLQYTCVYSARATPGSTFNEASHPPYVSSAKNPVQFINDLNVIPNKKRPSESASATVTISLDEFEQLKLRLLQIESALGGKSKMPSDSTFPKPTGGYLEQVPVRPVQQQTFPIDSQNQYLHLNGVYPAQNEFGQLLLQPSSYQSDMVTPKHLNVRNEGQVDISPKQGSASMVAPPFLQDKLPSQITFMGQKSQPGSIAYGKDDMTTNNDSSIQLPPLRFQNLSQQRPGEPIATPLGVKSGEIFQRANSSSQPSMESLSYASTNRTSLFSTSQVHSNKSQNAPVTFESLIGVHPYSGENDTISFYEGYSGIHIKEDTRSINFGPFAWASIMKRDRGLSLLWESVSKKSKGKVDLYYSNVSTAPDMLPTEPSTEESNFEKLNLDSESTDLIPYASIKTSESVKNKELTKEEITKLALTYYDGKLDRELKLIEKIKIILPHKKVIWLLIKKYFTHMYLYAPFLDHDSFVKEISNLIGPETDADEPVKELNVERRLDLAQLGLLLVVMRLTYLSLFSNKSSINQYNLNNNDPSPEARELKFILSNPINIDTIAIARECFEQFQSLKRVSLPILQLAFFLKLYNIYAPEEGDVADGEPQTLNGIVLQMAYQVGLNREPDNLPNILNDQKQNNLRRKMWGYIVLWDLYYGCTLGNPMMINQNSFDTKLPYHVPGNENCPDVELDIEVTKHYASCAIVPNSILRALLLVLNVRGRIHMSDLCANLSEYEEKLHAGFGSLSVCCRPSKETTKKSEFTINLRTKYYLFIKAFLMSIYFYFYLHYEQTDVNLSYFYLKKIMLINCTDIMQNYHLFEGEGTGCDMILNPSLQNIVNKSNHLIFSWIIRINFKIYLMKKLPGHAEKYSQDSVYRRYFKSLCKLSSYLTRCAEISMAAVSTLSTRYYYAWRLAKGHTFLLKTITSVEFYEENASNASALSMPDFTLDQIEELLSICELALNISPSGLENGQFAVNEKSRIYYEIFSNSNSVIRTPSDEISSNSQSRKNTAVEFVESNEIDKFWLDMLAKKYDKLLYGILYSPETDYNGVSSHTASNPGVASSASHDQNLFNGIDIDRFGFDIEQSNKFDIFSDLPFDHFFKSNG